MLTVLLLAWSIRMGCATASRVDVAKLLRGGAVGVLFDPEQRNQPRNPHSIHDGDAGFFVVVGPSGRVSVARVLLRVSYSDHVRSAAYDIEPPKNAKTLALTNPEVDAKVSQRVLTGARGELTQLGRACWSGRVAMNNPYVGVVPAQPQHALIQIGLKPDAVVFRDSEHSLELQCDARADNLESAVASLLRELKLTWRDDAHQARECPRSNAPQAWARQTNCASRLGGRSRPHRTALSDDFLQD